MRRHHLPDMKMKNFYWWLLLCVGCSGASHYNFSIVGNIDDVRNGRALLMTESRDDTVCAAGLDDGRFELSGTLEGPGRYVLKVNRRSFSFFMDGEEMFIDCPYDSLSAEQVKGSRANDIALEYGHLEYERYTLPQERLLDEYVAARDRGDLKKADALMTEVLELDVARYRLARDFVREYPDNVFSAYAADVAKKDRYEWGEALWRLLAPEARDTPYGRELKEHLDVLAKSAIGRSLPDVAVTDSAGREVRLSSLKGAPLVLDFWASWCGPCRQEMQSLKTLYGEFQGENVRFVSISLDDDKDKWAEACAEERIPWLSLLDKGWTESEMRRQLGIESIPCIILVDAQGNIAAKNVRRNILREELIKLLDTDLRPTERTIALLNGFFDYTQGRSDVTERATWVLYNLKNEAVREAYVLWALEQKLGKGENYDIGSVLDDIDLTSPGTPLRQKAEALIDSYARLKAGEKAVDFLLERLDGEKTRLVDFSGKMLYLCVLEADGEKAAEELEALRTFRNRQGNRFAYLVVAVGDAGDRDGWLRFIESKGYDKLFVNAFADRTDAFLEDYKVRTLPRYVLIGADGRFLAPWFFSPTLEEQWRYVLDYMLKK